MSKYIALGLLSYSAVALVTLGSAAAMEVAYVMAVWLYAETSVAVMALYNQWRMK